MAPKSLLVLLILLAQIFKLVLSELTLSTHCLGETLSVSESLVADAPAGDIKSLNYQCRLNEIRGWSGYLLGLLEKCVSAFVNVGASYLDVFGPMCDL